MSDTHEVLNLRQVECFVAAAEAGSMTAAAERLRVSQSAVSLAVAGLERSLGTDLFLRHRGRGLTLTAAGRELLLPARNLMADAEAMRSQADVIGRGLSGTADRRLLRHRRAAGAAGADGDLRAPLSRACRSTSSRADRRARAALLDGRCEIALMYDVGLHVALEKEPLYSTVPYALFAPEHPLAGRASVTLAELAEYDFVALDVQPVHEHQLGLFAHAGVHAADPLPHLAATSCCARWSPATSASRC